MSKKKGAIRIARRQDSPLDTTFYNAHYMRSLICVVLAICSVTRGNNREQSCLDQIPNCRRIDPDRNHGSSHADPGRDIQFQRPPGC